MIVVRLVDVILKFETKPIKELPSLSFPASPISCTVFSNVFVLIGVNYWTYWEKDKWISLEKSGVYKIACEGFEARTSAPHQMQAS
jgi:hypothetical protein